MGSDNQTMKQFLKFRPKLRVSIIYGGIPIFSSLYLIIDKKATTATESWLISLVSFSAAVSFGLITWSAYLTLKNSRWKKYIHHWAQRTAFTTQFVSDSSFRTILFTYSTLGMNIFLTLTKVWLGLRYFSYCFGLLAGYYLVICLARFHLLRNHRKVRECTSESNKLNREWSAYHMSGFLLMVMTLFLQVAVLQRGWMGNIEEVTPAQDKLIYALACYDFGCLTNALVQLYRLRKEDRPIIMAIKTLSFATTVVSLLSLQSAMFASFGSESTLREQQSMSRVTGTAVCILLFIISCHMLKKGWKEKEQVRGEKT